MDEAKPKVLSGTAEIDEIYVGGKKRHVWRGNMDGKTMVPGAIQRGGEVRLRVEKRRRPCIASCWRIPPIKPNASCLLVKKHELDQQ